MRYVTRLLTFLFLLGLTAAAEAQTVTRIRYFVVPNMTRPSELFEVVEGARTGGRLIRDGRAEYIPGPSGGVSVGYTDRAASHELFIHQVIGSGVVSIQIRAGNQVLATFGGVRLPTVSSRQIVGGSPLFGPISIAAVVGNRIIAQRPIPIGPRP